MYVENTNAIRRVRDSSSGVPVAAEVVQQEREETQRRTVRRIVTVVLIIVAIVAAVHLIKKYVIPKILEAWEKLPPIGAIALDETKPPTLNTFTPVPVVEPEPTMPIITTPVPAVVKKAVPARPGGRALDYWADPMHSNFVVESVVNTELTPVSTSSSSWTALPALNKSTSIVNAVLPVLSVLSTVLLAF